MQNFSIIVLLRPLWPKCQMSPFSPILLMSCGNLKTDTDAGNEFRNEMKRNVRRVGSRAKVNDLLNSDQITPVQISGILSDFKYHRPREILDFFSSLLL